ncbi:hypothetical protein [Candidatus Albibeggiatoa sp. nov. BB20]|uniref:hypothetical protein n=1 Tax=Candidatus Albibeggiatoa sp. nov. BB20 TaxID=3162723 RepID=UPI00336597D5
MSTELLLDVGDFAESEQDLQALLRELSDSDMVESAELCEPDDVMRGAKGGLFDKLRLITKPENIKATISFISDVYWKFVVPPRIKITLKTDDGKTIQIEMNRKEDLDDILKKL